MDCAQPTDPKTQPRGTRADPCTVVIFGASGDLTRRKLVPALANLEFEGLLAPEIAVVGVATRPWTDEDFRANARGALESFKNDNLSESVESWIEERFFYLSGDVQSDETYERLRALLTRVDERAGTRGNFIYYLATAPRFFSEIPRRLASVGLVDESGGSDARSVGWRRVVVEKPFGVDLDSARRLNRDLWEVLREEQIYRIDHYLGKETVQNILAFRFANGIFEPIWNRRYVDHVQITVGESLGVEQRGASYEHSGALRDMVPNHIFQLITLTAMEPPVSFRANAVRDEQVKILSAIVPFSPESVARDTVRGQYGDGTSDGEAVSAYRSENRVDPRSSTETYAAMKLFVENWRWAGVPFYLRTGKRLAKRATEIAIRFKRAPFSLFRETSIHNLRANWLILRLQPDEGISLTFGAKVPGAVMRLGNVDMDFSYEEYFGSRLHTGYERLLYDCMLGDATLFQRADMVEAGWTAVAPILETWARESPADFPNYPAGSWGPRAADELLERDGLEWRNCP